MRVPEQLRRSLPYLGVAIGVVFYVAVSFGGGLGYSRESRPMPKLEAKTLGSGAAVTDGSLRGKPAIINVWAPSCFPCTREMPGLDRLAERYRGRVNVLALTAWGSPEEAQAVASAKHLASLPVLVGGESFLKELEVESVPTTFFVDADGRIVARQVGIRGEGFFRDQAELLLSGKLAN
jgi:thiol-disulfide isomerase/thioredoxin